MASTTKIKVFNKGQKIVAINGSPVLPGETIEMTEAETKSPVIASLIRQGFLETNASQGGSSAGGSAGGSTGGSTGGEETAGNT